MRENKTQAPNLLKYLFIYLAVPGLGCGTQGL